MKHQMSGDLIVSRRYLYAYRLFPARVHCPVAQCADVLRVRCQDQSVAAAVDSGCVGSVGQGDDGEAGCEYYPSNVLGD